MKAILILAALAALPLAVRAETESFEGTADGALPQGWQCGVTGSGGFKWAVATDPSAPSGKKVLQQSGRGSFPWCVKSAVSVADGFIEVKFKAIGGSEDQAGGVVWRWKDGNNYYVARANALENNVSLYHTTNGRRITIKYVDAPVARNVWHTLRVEFKDQRISVALDGKRYIDLEDSHIAGAGALGVWTKADSVTSFDAFAYGGF